MVEGFTGLMGSGKTYLATARALQAIKQGRSVFSNYKIIGARKWTELAEAVQVRHDPEHGINEPVIIIDEVNLVCPSRSWESLPMDVLYFWAQSRKFGVDVWWTSQHISRVDKALREITYDVWHCRRVNFFFFSLHSSHCFLPEQVLHASMVGSPTQKGFMEPLDKKMFAIQKKVYTKYDTMEPIDLPAHIVNKIRQNPLKRVLSPVELPMVFELPKTHEVMREGAKWRRRVASREKTGLGLTGEQA